MGFMKRSTGTKRKKFVHALSPNEANDWFRKPEIVIDSSNNHYNMNTKEKFWLQG